MDPATVIISLILMVIITIWFEGGGPDAQA